MEKGGSQERKVGSHGGGTIYRAPLRCLTPDYAVLTPDYAVLPASQSARWLGGQTARWLAR